LVTERKGNHFRLARLWGDLGVRAMLAILAAVGYYGPLIWVLVKYSLPVEVVVALIGAANAPWMTALGFYFGSRTQTPTDKPPGG
jgi:hypothetical protein